MSKILSSTNGGNAGKKVLKTVVIVVVVGLIAAGGFFFYKYLDQNKEIKDLNARLTTASAELETFKNNPQEAQAVETKKYIDAIGKLYALPEGEEPSVATVRDKDKLKDQAFFAKAENGDITLIYSTAKIAILYRPSTNQLVNVSTVTIQDQQPAATPTP